MTFTIWHWIVKQEIIRKLAKIYQIVILAYDISHLTLNFQTKTINTRNMVYNGHREIGLVLALKFFPEKTISGQTFEGGRSIWPQIVSII